MNGDGLTDRAARTTVAKVVVAGETGFAPDLAASCVLANASAAERLALASDAPIPPTAATRATVNGILNRPGTIACLDA